MCARKKKCAQCTHEQDYSVTVERDAATLKRSFHCAFALLYAAKKTVSKAVEVRIELSLFFWKLHAARAYKQSKTTNKLSFDQVKNTRNGHPHY